MGVLSDPIPLFNRSAIFNSDSPAPGKTIITLLPKEREIIGDVIYRLFKSFQPAGKIFQDKNFSIPDVEQFSVDVDVVGTKVNVFDIYKDDQLFTNGELNPTKTEYCENTNETEYFPLPKQLRSDITSLSNFLLEVFPENNIDPEKSVNKDKNWTATEDLSSL